MLRLILTGPNLPRPGVTRCYHPHDACSSTSRSLVRPRVAAFLRGRSLHPSRLSLPSDGTVPGDESCDRAGCGVRPHAAGAALHPARASWRGTAGDNSARWISCRGRTVHPEARGVDTARTSARPGGHTGRVAEWRCRAAARPPRPDRRRPGRWLPDRTIWREKPHRRGGNGDLRQYIEADLRLLARAELGRRLHALAGVHGLTVAGVTIRNQTSRWG